MARRLGYTEAMAQPIRKTPELNTDDRRNLERLQACLRRYPRLLVAFSGGVDSTLLLQVAVDTLGRERVLAVLGDSASLARSERQEAFDLAARIGARLRTLETYELENPSYAANPTNRCYFCKSELYTHLGALARAEGFDAIADGTNQDDVGDFRPGRQAARENAVVSPLLEAGLGKDDVRALSRAYGLPTWDKPAMPCLASRIPYGNAVSAAKLGQVERAEAVLRAHGIRGGRVRHHGAVARIELPSGDLPRLADPVLRASLTRGVREAGFEFVTADLDGYRRGRLNELAGVAPERRSRPDVTEDGAAAPSTP